MDFEDKQAVHTADLGKEPWMLGNSFLIFTKALQD